MEREAKIRLKESLPQLGIKLTTTMVMSPTRSPLSHLCGANLF